MNMPQHRVGAGIPVAARRSFRIIRPQQASQGLAAARLVCLNNQVGEQRSRFVRGETNDGTAVQRHCEGPEQMKAQASRFRAVVLCTGFAFVLRCFHSQLLSFLQIASGFQ